MLLFFTNFFSPQKFLILLKTSVQKFVYQTEYYKFSFKIFNSYNLTRKYGIISTIGIKKIGCKRGRYNPENLY